MITKDLRNLSWESIVPHLRSATCGPDGQWQFMGDERRNFWHFFWCGEDVLLDLSDLYWMGFIYMMGFTVSDLYWMGFIWWDLSDLYGIWHLIHMLDGSMGFTLWLCQNSYWKWWLSSWIFPWKMVIFQSAMLNYQRVSDLYGIYVPQYA